LLPRATFYVAQLERGHGKQKRYWGIKMNDVRELYLKMYGIIDTLDKYILNVKIGLQVMEVLACSHE
jgi:hypothetical protein